MISKEQWLIIKILKYEKKWIFNIFKMMGWERLKICEWVKDALAISKIRIASWFTRLSMVRLNDTFLDLIKFHYTNMQCVFYKKLQKSFFDIENQINFCGYT